MALRSGACAFFGLAGVLSEGWGAPGFVTLGFFLAAYLAGAWDAAIESWGLLRHLHIDIHFLMLAVALGAAVIGAWGEGALLLFLFSAAGAMEHYAMGRTRRDINALLKGAPKTARVIVDDQEREVLVEDLEPGMVVRLYPNEKIPADLIVLEGESACDESNLTGESREVTKHRGDSLMAGTLNLWGVMEARVARPASESALQKILDLIQKAQRLRAPSQRFTDRFKTRYTHFVLLGCMIMFLVWWLAVGLPAFINLEEQPSAFYRTMTLLVVASPCALVISVPSAILSAIAAGARRGVLFRGGAAVEGLADTRVAAFDKTGTLTVGKPEFTRIDVFEGDETATMTLAFNLARFSDHPLSRAIKRLGIRKHLQEWDPHALASTPGQGVEGEVNGNPARLGRRSFVLGDEKAPPAGEQERIGEAAVWIKGPGQLARLAFQDPLRAEASELLGQLRAAGLRCVILTGDLAAVAREMAAQAGVADVRAGLLPDDKVAAIQELKADGSRVAMVGDGVNDAPCLAAADTGVAMGASGSDAALEQADVILMHDELEKFLAAYRLSVRAKRIIRQNVVIALGTVVTMVIATFIYPVPLALGVAAHEGSTVLVVLNSLRLLTGR